MSKTTVLPFEIMTKQLNFVVAMSCEAKPLIDLYALKPIHSKPFRVYGGQHDNMIINLIVTGIGSVNMAAAVGWLAANCAHKNTAWLNVGVAGHKSAGIGKAFQVHQVVDAVTEQGSYPPLVVNWPGSTIALLSCHSQTTDYPDVAAVDMEGAAFFKTATLFSSAELVQSVKVISDNRSNSVERLNAALITELVQGVASDINSFAQALGVLLLSEIDLTVCDEFIADIHCSVSQRHQYHQYCQKLNAMHLLTESNLSFIKRATSMKKVLIKLQELLDQAQPDLVRKAG